MTQYDYMNYESEVLVKKGLNKKLCDLYSRNIPKNKLISITEWFGIIDIINTYLDIVI